MKMMKKTVLKSLAALLLIGAADSANADHGTWSSDPWGWSAPRQWGPGPQRQSRQRWQGWGWGQGQGWQRRPEPRVRQGLDTRGGRSVIAQPDRSQNVDPEPETTTQNVIFTYRADPLVALGDSNLEPSFGDTRAVSGGESSAAVDRETLRRETFDPLVRTTFELLKARTSGVRVTDEQRKAIVAFYRERKFAPIWVSDQGVSPRARDLLGKLSDAGKEGLKAEDYLPPELSGFSDGLDAFPTDRERLARLELGLTAMALRYAMHASGGRIIPNRLSGYHDLAPPTVKPDEALARLAGDGDPAEYLASLHPIHPAYRALTEELAELRAEAGDEVAEAPIGDGPAIKPGQSDPRIPAIRARLARLGHLALATVEPSGGEGAAMPVFGSPDDVVAVQPVAVNSAVSDVLDEPLVEGVKAFQSAAGLSADGVIGPKTVAAMNADTSEERIRRLVYSIERLRWMPRDFGAKHVLVNPASFTARVVENGETVWQTKVIVGKPTTQTAFFSDEMETVVINPYWGVPASIIVKEMVRDMRGDPSWFEREGYEILDAKGRVISPYSVNWPSISMSNIKIGVRQPPGPNNALGEIKFLFPNKHLIYMHDTPSKPLFSKPVRAFSHGCVRVENPRKFAEYILGWDAERIAAEIEMGGDNKSVQLENKIPVHLAYFTAWPDESGKVQYFEDVYGRDDLLERAFGTLVLAMQ